MSPSASRNGTVSSECTYFVDGNIASEAIKVRQVWVAIAEHCTPGLHEAVLKGSGNSNSTCTCSSSTREKQIHTVCLLTQHFALSLLKT